jgi:hypothetical protein
MRRQKTSRDPIFATIAAHQKAAAALTVVLQHKRRLEDKLGGKAYDGHDPKQLSGDHLKYIAEQYRNLGPGSVPPDELDAYRCRIKGLLFAQGIPLLSDALPYERQNRRTTILSFRAIFGLMHRGKDRYAMTSSAVASSLSGTLSPSALAVLRLMTRSYFVDCVTGRSDGFAPLRIRPA